MGDVAIQVENLGKRFRLGLGGARYDTLREALVRAVRPKRDNQRDLWALRGVDLRVERGEALGIIGPNGAGKTTLLRILAGITFPTEGIARTRGTVGSLLDVGTGFHPELTGRENVFLSGTVLGMRRGEVRDRFDEIVEFSGVERFLDTPVKRYSAGMRLRLAFAVAAHLEPPIVVVDEVLAVGDSAFREKCMGKMAEMGQRDRTVLFVSHDLGAITRLCSRAVWLESGNIQSDGPAREVVSAYLRRGAAAGRTLDVEFDAQPDAPAAVTRLTVRDTRTGQVLNTPERGSPFTIEIVVEVRETIIDLNFALILIDELGVVIIDDAVRDRPFAGRRSGEPGTYVFAATIPPLLRAGTYLLRGWVGNDFEYAERDLLRIRVAARPDDPQEFAERPRAVQPDIEWRVRRDPSL